MSCKHIQPEWHIYQSVNYAIIGSDNGLLPVRQQNITRTNAGALIIGSLCNTWIQIHHFSYKKINLKMSFATVSQHQYLFQLILKINIDAETQWQLCIHKGALCIRKLCEKGKRTIYSHGCNVWFKFKWEILQTIHTKYLSWLIGLDFYINVQHSVVNTCVKFHLATWNSHVRA